MWGYGADRMREIKFRVLDTLKKRYLAGTDRDSSYSTVPILMPWGKKLMLYQDKYECFAQVIDVGRYIWEQYTGLKDKNGKEIYEGDILEQWNDVLNRWESKVIITSIEDFYFKEQHEFNFMCGNDDYTIRGNIHDNPELLEGVE